MSDTLRFPPTSSERLAAIGYPAYALLSEATAMLHDLRAVARALHGDVSGRNSIVCPGPGHGPKDRSLSVTLDPTAPDGFIVHSFADDDWHVCRDDVRERLDPYRATASRRPTEARRRPPCPRPEDEDQEKTVASAIALWTESIDPRGTIVETYLQSRGLDLGDDIAGGVLRWNPRMGAMVALFRNIKTDEPQAVSRTFLDSEGRKIARKFLGPVGGAAVKLDSDENVLTGLHVAEGIESALAARQRGFCPAWALGSAAAIGRFRVLDGIEALTVLAENDAANARAVAEVGQRWRAAGREVLLARPKADSDMNDVLRRRAGG